MNKHVKDQSAKLAESLAAWERRVREDLRRELLQSGQQHFIDLAGTVHDTGDESVADMLTDLESTLYERHLTELREIEAARVRLNEGNINCCLDCAGEIGWPRLLAYPVAVRCVDCQRQFEKTHRHAATPGL
jgi:DnaK suppressor protein